MGHSPLATICVANYNNAAYLTEALDSIYNQTYQNIELIIIDDCSKDKSVSLIDDWISLKKTRFASVEFIKHEVNRGINYVVNLMLERATGEYFSMLASDDAILPDKLAIQVNTLEELGEEYAMVYGDTMIIDENGKTIDASLFKGMIGDIGPCPSGHIFNEVVENFFFYNQAVLIRMSAIKALNFRFNEKYISEDWYLQLCLAKKYKVQGLRTVFAKYRILPTSVTRQNWNEKNMHKVTFSHFLMLYSFLKAEKIESETRAILTQRLRKLMFFMDTLTIKSRPDLIKIAWVVFLKSFNFYDAVCLMNLLLTGNLTGFRNCLL